MSVRTSAPLLSRVKSWQLVGLGVSGWITIYSTSIVSLGANNTLAGNLQGGCFAAAMALAGFETRRFKKPKAEPVDPFQWTSIVTTEHVNQAVVETVLEKEHRIEASHPAEAEMGFGVRAVNSGRTWVYETGRWQEQVIDLDHAKATEENRKKVLADFAVIVGAGTPDEDTKIFVKTHPVQLLVGDELKKRLVVELPPSLEIDVQSESTDETI